MCSVAPFTSVFLNKVNIPNNASDGRVCSYTRHELGYMATTHMKHVYCTGINPVIPFCEWGSELRDYKSIFTKQMFWVSSHFEKLMWIVRITGCPRTGTVAAGRVGRSAAGWRRGRCRPWWGARAETSVAPWTAAPRCWRWSSPRAARTRRACTWSSTWTGTSGNGRFTSNTNVTQRRLPHFSLP